MNPFLKRLTLETPLLAEGTLLCLLDFQPQLAESPFFKRVRDLLKPQASITEDGMAIVPVEGVLARKPSVEEMYYDGVEDSNNILNMLAMAASNPAVRGILLDVDSPGGFYTGGPEMADMVKAVQKTKPVVSWVGGVGASLAYWVASQAQEVIASRSAMVGSIGAYTTHIDISKMLEERGIKLEVFRNKEGTLKAPGLMNTPLNDEQRNYIQERIQANFQEFKRTVTSARPAIPEDAMHGQVFTGTAAKRNGLIDRVGDRNYALYVLRQMVRVRGN